MTLKIKYQIPDLLKPLFTEKHQYYVVKGGRGSGKSWQIAFKLLMDSLTQQHVILCAREFQTSIKDSVYKLLKSLINKEYEMTDGTKSCALAEYFSVTRDSIKTIPTGSEFIFKGLARNIDEIKSTEGITRCWVEEAHLVSEDSWDLLIPTVFRDARGESELYVSFNPKEEKSATYQRFVAHPPTNCLNIHINWDQNPFCPPLLKYEAELMRKNNPELYRHIWAGDPKIISDAIVFKDRFEVLDFEVEVSDRFQTFNKERIKWYVGLDFGFSVDPLAVVACFIKDDNLFISHELYNYELDLDDIIPAIKSKMSWVVPNSCKIYADCARPDIISQLSSVRRHKDGTKLEALNIKGAPKGKDSVETGIEYLKNFKKIYIHPSCVNTLYEFESYSYRQDKVTGEIMPLLVDKHNHIIDALRYALSDNIQLTRRPIVFTDNMIRQIGANPYGYR
jgi:phage terminase large subunit